MSNETTNNKPVAEIRDGLMKIAIFRNEPKTPDGYVTFSHKLTRSYKDGNNQWQETTYLSGTENLRAANLYQLAYNREVELRAADKLADAASGDQQ